MFSPAQALYRSGLCHPIAPMEAMFNLLFRFWPRKSVGTPNASAPTAREVVLIKSRRLTPADETDSRELNRGIFLADCAFATGSTGRGERGGAQRRAGRFRHRPQRTGTGDWHHFRHIPFQVLCGRDTDGVLHTAASQRLVKAITLYCGPRGARSIGKRPTTLQPRETSSSSGYQFNGWN
jgi:hypothetical protein